MNAKLDIIEMNSKRKMVEKVKSHSTTITTIKDERDFYHKNIEKISPYLDFSFAKYQTLRNL